MSTNVHEVSYDGLWVAFNQTDGHWSTCPPGTIHDIYSLTCWKYKTQQCGNYKKEGDCYNREHSWPKSWWGGESADQNAYTDLHHIFPADGYDNNRRGDFPYGSIEKGSEIYVTDNGCRLGVCNTTDFGEITCWEVTDSLKGDLARGYFYMSTRYMTEFKCCNEEGVDDAKINAWMEDVLRQWNAFDPVSNDEMYRQNQIYEIQGNRNPFIDNPEWVSYIYDF